MISRTPRVALTGVALALAMVACTSTDADDAGTADDAVTTAGDASVATLPTGTEPDTGSAPADAPVVPATTESAPGTDTTAPSEPEPVVPEALQFSAPLVGGGQFDGAAVADKPTLFWFWAPT